MLKVFKMVVGISETAESKNNTTVDSELVVGTIIAASSMWDGFGYYL